MGLPIISEIEKLITEHGSAAVLKEHLSLLKTQIDLFERKITELTDENQKLKALVRPELSKADLKLATKYFEHFPPDGNVLNFLRNHDMGAIFHESNIKPLWAYTDNWNGPNFEFLDQELELARREFDESLRNFVKVMFFETAPAKTEGFFSMGMKDLEDDLEVIQTRDHMNTLSTKAAEKFDNFFRIARTRFPDADLG